MKLSSIDRIRLVSSRGKLRCITGTWSDWPLCVRRKFPDLKNWNMHGLHIVTLRGILQRHDGRQPHYIGFRIDWEDPVEKTEEPHDGWSDQSRRVHSKPSEIEADFISEIISHHRQRLVTVEARRRSPLLIQYLQVHNRWSSDWANRFRRQ